MKAEHKAAIAAAHILEKTIGDLIQAENDLLRSIVAAAEGFHVEYLRELLHEMPAGTQRATIREILKRKEEENGLDIH